MAWRSPSSRTHCCAGSATLIHPFIPAVKSFGRQSGLHHGVERLNLSKHVDGHQCSSCRTYGLWLRQTQRRRLDQTQSGHLPGAESGPPAIFRHLTGHSARAGRLCANARLAADATLDPAEPYQAVPARRMRQRSSLYVLQRARHVERQIELKISLAMLPAQGSLSCQCCRADNPDVVI